MCDCDGLKEIKEYTCHNLNTSTANGSPKHSQLQTFQINMAYRAVSTKLLCKQRPTPATIKERCFYVARVATVAMQRREKHVSTTIEGLCVLRGPCQSDYKKDNWGDPNS